MKKLLLLALILAMCLSMCACASAAESVPTTPPTSVATQPATEPATVPMDKEVAVATYTSIITDACSAAFDFAGTSGDEKTFYIGVARDGLADTFNQAKNAGFSNNFEPWLDVKNTMLEMYDSFSDIAITLGLNDTEILLMLLNDKNHDNALLIIQDGVVTYDFMAK